MSETFYVCSACASGKTLEQLRAYRPVVTQEGNVTTWDCPECGRNILLSIDEGTLDLGIVRDSQLKDVFDYELFTDPPPS